MWHSDIDWHIDRILVCYRCLTTDVVTGGSLFLFDRRAVRFFRKDAHNWRKKADGKTVRETHEKLKVSFPATPSYLQNAAD